MFNSGPLYTFCNVNFAGANIIEVSQKLPWMLGARVDVILSMNRPVGFPQLKLLQKSGRFEAAAAMVRFRSSFQKLAQY